MVGRTLGPYRVLEKLGAGGMGEVYLARDTRLNRDVAIKVLPDALAHDPERLARFTREAETLATLNHPHVAQVYGFETDGAACAIAMELVTGRTLADAIANRLMPLDDALSIARQIALALEAAHDRGIVHRDLKPGNIMITDDAVVKVLDFGLARTLDAAGERIASASTLAQSPTAMSPALTHMGTILGTAAYMAPEQARGKPIDKRVDLWAFGCVLYEMLTGRVAFAADDVTGTLAKVLEAAPELTALPANTPASIRRLLQRCLVKDRRDRLGDASTARLEIDDARLAPSPDSMAATRPRPPWWRRSLPWPVAAVAVIAAVAVPLWRGAASPATATPISRFDIALPPGDVFRDSGWNDHTGLALSADGRTLYYTAIRNGISYAFKRRFDDASPVLIPGTEGAGPLFVTPGQDWLVFGSLRPPMLKKVSLAGGPPVAITTARSQILGIDDLPSGDFLFGDHSSGIFRVPSSGGDAVAVVEIDQTGPQRFPVVLPGDRGLLFTVGGVPVSNRIAVLPSGATAPRFLTNGTDARYLPTGHIVFWRDGSLFAAPFDLSRLEIDGDAVPVVERVQVRGTGAAAFTWSPDGSLAYIQDVKPPDRRLVWVDRQGAETPLEAPPGPYAAPRLAPDDSKVIVSYRATTTEDIWLHDIARKVTEPFVAEPVSEWVADWSPNGEMVLFTSRRAGPFGLYGRRVNGLGDIELIAGGIANLHGPTPDGREVLLSVGSSGLSTIDLRTGVRREILPAEGMIADAQISPDGRWLAYSAAEDRRESQVWVHPYPDVQANRWRISTDRGRLPHWSGDSRTIFFRRGQEMMSVAVRTSPSFSHDAPVRLFAGPYLPEYDLARDGRFLMVKDADESPASGHRIIVVLNWFEDLRARLRR